MLWHRALIWFMVPSLVVLTAVKFYPLAYSFYLSFFDFYLASPEQRFVGLANYDALLTGARFWQALRTTCLIVVSALAVQFTFGLAIALALYRFSQRTTRVLTVLLFLPNIITPVVAGMLMRWMFVGRWGLIDSAFAATGIVPPDWLGHPVWAKVTIVLADTWQHTPFMILVLFAGLHGLDRSVVEAGVIDGARGLRLLWHVILPALRPVILFVLVIRTMDLFRIFDSIYVLTGGGPGTATETITLYTYTMAFRLLQIGQASALGVLTMLVITVLVGALILTIYRRERGAF
jgi:multiple sugar transport system permease protein